MKWWIKYIFHFAGGILFCFVFGNIGTVIIIAVTWEVAQFEYWWNLYDYDFGILYSYDWIDTLIDIGLALIGAWLVYSIFGLAT